MSGYRSRLRHRAPVLGAASKRSGGALAELHLDVPYLSTTGRVEGLSAHGKLAVKMENTGAGPVLVWLATKAKGPAAPDMVAVNFFDGTVLGRGEQDEIDGVRMSGDLYVVAYALGADPAACAITLTPDERGAAILERAKGNTRGSSPSTSGLARRIEALKGADMQQAVAFAQARLKADDRAERAVFKDATAPLRHVKDHAAGGYCYACSIMDDSYKEHQRPVLPELLTKVAVLPRDVPKGVRRVVLPVMDELGELVGMQDYEGERLTSVMAMPDYKASSITRSEQLKAQHDYLAEKAASALRDWDTAFAKEGQATAEELRNAGAFVATMLSQIFPGGVTA